MNEQAFRPPARRVSRSRPAPDYEAFLRHLRALLDRSGVAYASRRPLHHLPRCTACAADRSAEHSEAPSETAIERVKGFVEEHAGEALSLERLAQEAHLSKHHFARLFRKQTGTTPWAYVRETRLRQAKKLLEEDLSLSEVAFRTGFYDQSHFTKAFKDAEGQTPGAYQEERKDIQEEEPQLG